MKSRPWLCPLFGRKSRPRPSRSRTRPLLEALECRLAPAVLLTYGGPGTILSLLEQASAATPAVSISEPAPGQLEINLGASTFAPTSTTAAPGLTYEVPGSPATSHLADIDIGQANNVTTLQATLPGDTLTLGVIADASGGLGNVAASADVITVTGLDTSNASAGNGNVDLKAAGALRVARNALLDTGTGTLALAADVNADGTGNSNGGVLFIASGATVVSASASSSAITLRGAAIDLDTSANPAIVGAPRDALLNTPTATLTGVNAPRALAFDARGDLFVANSQGTTVSEFAPGSTTPTATLTGLNSPTALAFDARGDLFVANAAFGTVSEFAPGSTTPTATLTGLDSPAALAFDAHDNLFVASSGDNTVREFAPGSTTPTATLTGLDFPTALAFDASGDLFVANGDLGSNTVSEFAPGSTTPTATLKGLNGPRALAFGASGNLFVANSDFPGTVSEFAPGSTTPTATLKGLSGPIALAFDPRGDLFVANVTGITVSEFAPGSTTPTAALTGLNGPTGLAFDARGDLFVANSDSPGTVSEFAVKPAAGGVVIRTAQPGQSISVGTSAAGTGLAISNAELAQIFTTASGTITLASGAITFGDPSQTGTITFAAATPATTPGTSVVAVQSPTGPGTIVLDDAIGTALAAGIGNVSLTAGSGGIVTTGSDTTADIATTGQVTLNTPGGVGSSAHRVVFAATQTPAGVVVGDTSAPRSGVYLSGLGALTLDDIGTTNAPLDVTAAATLTVARQALLDTGSGTISLAADVNTDGTANSNRGTLAIASGATVVTDNASKSAITLRGATIAIDTGPAPAVVGARRDTTPTATLTGLNSPGALAFDAHGNLFVANGPEGLGTTVSEFTPGSTTPTATLTGLNGPAALAFDAQGNLFVASYDDTVSEFAPGSTSPTATLSGLNDPRALAFDAFGNLFVANGNGTTVSEFAPGSTTPTATLTGLSAPIALAFDAFGNLFVANAFSGTVSEFAPGSTTPTATLKGLNDPYALAFDASGNLFVANYGGTVSEFAPGSTTPTATLTGLYGPVALAFDARGNLFVANGDGTTVSEFAPGSTTPTATLNGLTGPVALAFDARDNLFVANLYADTVSEFALQPAAGGVVIRTAQPRQSINVGATAATTGLAISNAELTRIFTTGAITFGDPTQTGNITFAAATPATTPAASVVALQSGSGSIVLIDVSGTALAAGTGNVSLTAGSGGIVATGSDTTATIATTGQVTLNTPGGVGSSGNPIVFLAKPKPASVVVGDTSAPGSGVYLLGLGALTLGEVHTQSAPLDVTAAAALTTAGAVSAGNVKLTATAFTVNAGASVTAVSADALSVSANTLTLLGTLSAGSTGVVTLKPFTTTRNIDLGGTGPSTDLVLSNSALGRVTAGTLRIGDVTADTGDITVTGSVSSHPGYATLFLQTQKGSINEANGATITVANLALQAGSGIGTTGDLHTAVTNLAFANQSGAIHISNTACPHAHGRRYPDRLVHPGQHRHRFLSVVGSVYTLLHSSGGVNGQISYNGRALPEGATLILADGNRYQISYKAGGGQDVTLTRIGSVAGAKVLGQTIQAGRAAGIGFWADAAGQALIRSFNGGPTSPALADWLAATLPNLYGAGAGPHDVSGQTNAKVAELLRTLSRARAWQPEAQVLATALDVYATTGSLGGRAARRDGFRVTAVGLGAAAYTIGVQGDAFGVPRQTVLDVDQILEAADERTVDGVLEDGNATLRHRADELFTKINTGT